MRSHKGLRLNARRELNRDEWRTVIMSEFWKPRRDPGRNHDDQQFSADRNKNQLFADDVIFHFAVGAEKVWTRRYQPFRRVEKALLIL
jgi:hypothetical protein